MAIRFRPLLAIYCCFLLGGSVFSALAMLGWFWVEPWDDVAILLTLAGGVFGLMFGFVRFGSRKRGRRPEAR